MLARFSRHWQKHRHIHYIYQGGPIEHGTQVPGPVAKSSAGSEYNSACTAGMALAHFMMLMHELLNKDPDIFTEEDPLIVLDKKSAMCIAKDGKHNKHTRHLQGECIL